MTQRNNGLVIDYFSKLIITNIVIIKTALRHLNYFLSFLTLIVLPQTKPKHFFGKIIKKYNY